jgi:hypothetical protein
VSFFSAIVKKGGARCYGEEKKVFSAEHGFVMGIMPDSRLFFRTGKWERYTPGIRF